MSAAKAKYEWEELSCGTGWEVITEMRPASGALCDHSLRVEGIRGVRNGGKEDTTV